MAWIWCGALLFRVDQVGIIEISNKGSRELVNCDIQPKNEDGHL